MGDKLYIVFLQEYMNDRVDPNLMGICSNLVGVYSNYDMVDEVKTEVEKVAKRRKNNGENDGYCIEEREVTLNKPYGLFVDELNECDVKGEIIRTLENCCPEGCSPDVLKREENDEN